MPVFWLKMSLLYINCLPSLWSSHDPR